ncbi:MAG: hypothetical protein AAB557_04555 [Patescibacteria group bacterium]
MSDWLNTLAALVESGPPINGDLASGILGEVIFDNTKSELFPESLSCGESINVEPTKEVKG